jgi:hypothetical protein
MDHVWNPRPNPGRAELPDWVSISVSAHWQTDETMVPATQIDGLPGQMKTTSHLFGAQGAAFGLQHLLPCVQASELSPSDDFFVGSNAWLRYGGLQGS